MLVVGRLAVEPRLADGSRSELRFDASADDGDAGGEARLGRSSPRGRGDRRSEGTVPRAAKRALERPVVRGGGAAPLPPAAARIVRPPVGKPAFRLGRGEALPLTSGEPGTHTPSEPVVSAEAVPPSEPPPPPVVADALHAEEVGPFSAVIRFTTSQDVPGVVGFGWDEQVSFASDGPGQDHRISLTGLVPGRRYTVKAISHDGEPKPGLSFTTGPRPADPHASIGEGVLELDGEPFFPVAAYGACPWNLENLLAAGANLFQWELGCGADESAIASSAGSLAGRGYWTVPWPQRQLTGPGQLGYTHPDEPDGQGLSATDLPAIQSPGKVSFVTFTQHFSPGTGALPWQSAGYYEAFVSKADVVGFDVYPLQGLCRPDKLALVHDVQVDLVELAGGKPTFQWIEAAPMNCRDWGGGVTITPETLRAEMLLAVAGGATGLGLFPASFDGLLAPAIRSTLDEIALAWPMLLTPRLPVAISGDRAAAVRASARERGGAIMLVVANADRDRGASVELQVAGLQGRELRPIAGSALLSVDDDLAHIELAPLEAHILVAAPSWTPDAGEDTAGAGHEEPTSLEWTSD